MYALRTHVSKSHDKLMNMTCIQCSNALDTFRFKHVFESQHVHTIN